MADISPAANAAWEAFNDVAERVGVFEDYGDALAAFTRALADHLVPHTAARTDGAANRRRLRGKLLAIAAELEGQR
jgi:hypothetical protein